MFVMHFVCFSDSAEIQIISSFEPIEALMNEHIMDHEIGKTVKHDSQPDIKTPIEHGHGTEEHQKKTRYGENEKKRVVFFEETFAGRVMVFMEVPHESMHHKFMSAPGYAFHNDECGQCYQCADHDTGICFS